MLTPEARAKLGAPAPAPPASPLEGASPPPVAPAVPEPPPSPVVPLPSAPARPRKATPAQPPAGDPGEPPPPAAASSEPTTAEPTTAEPPRPSLYELREAMERAEREAAERRAAFEAEQAAFDAERQAQRQREAEARLSEEQRARLAKERRFEELQASLSARGLEQRVERLIAPLCAVLDQLAAAVPDFGPIDAQIAADVEALRTLSIELGRSTPGLDTLAEGQKRTTLPRVHVARMLGKHMRERGYPDTIASALAFSHERASALWGF
jgi:hypothetical protein